MRRDLRCEKLVAPNRTRDIPHLPRQGISAILVSFDDVAQIVERVEKPVHGPAIDPAMLGNVAGPRPADVGEKFNPRQAAPESADVGIRRGLRYRHRTPPFAARALSGRSKPSG